MTVHDKLIYEINLKYDLNILKIEQFTRSDRENDNLLLILREKNKSYFFKEIPSHSLNDGLNHLFNELCGLNPANLKLALPLISKARNYIEKFSEKPSMIFPFIEHRVLNGKNVPPVRIISALNEFHQLGQQLKIPPHPFKTYENWIERGLQQVIKKIPNHPFLESFQNFIDTRLPNIQFHQGNCHFDLNPFNVWITPENQLFFTDFDNLQPAAMIKDFFDVMAIYLETDYVLIRERCKMYAVGLTDFDIPYLALRPKLGDLDYINPASLDYFFNFIKNQS